MTATCSKCKEERPVEEFLKTLKVCSPCRRAYQREWYQRNADKERANALARRNKNPEAARASATAWKKLNPERAKSLTVAWRETNKDKSRVHAWRANAVKKGCTCDLTSLEYSELLELIGTACFWCGSVATEIDHVVPLKPLRGGIRGHHRRDNIVASCRPCNKSKKNQDPLVFLFRVRGGVSL